jgi:hypothetical protein
MTADKICCNETPVNHIDSLCVNYLLHFDAMATTAEVYVKFLLVDSSKFDAR